MSKLKHTWQPLTSVNYLNYSSALKRQKLCIMMIEVNSGKGHAQMYIAIAARLTNYDAKATCMV